MVREYFSSVGKTALQENDELLERLTSMSPENFSSAAFPASLLDGCFYMGCDADEYKNSTAPGIPLELFSDFCHSFVFCFTGCTREEIEKGHNTFRNYTLVQKREVNHRELCSRLPVHTGVEEDFYIVWTIYRRNEGVAPDFGPKHFSVLAMNGDVLGNYGVIFHHGRHKPLCITLPTWGINWSSATFDQCNHSRPTREVVRDEFVPQAKGLVDMCFATASSKPEYLLTLRPFSSMGFGDDDFGSADLYGHFMSFFPVKALEIPARLCRNGAEGNLTLYSAK